MNKTQLLEQIITELESVHKNAVDATKLAHETATHGETVAENKYDTFGLEASYLAHGQAKRVAECETDLVAYKKLTAKVFSDKKAIGLGALIYLNDSNNNEKIIFLGPTAGGLKIVFNNDHIMVVTPSAPLGKSLIGRYVGDEIEMMAAGQKNTFEIIALY